jgi:dihydrofolate reductase
MGGVEGIMSKKRKLVLFIAKSLDGYIATKDDSLEWLFSAEGEGDNGYSEFYETVDTVLIGKRTYDWIMKHEKGEFPYKNKGCYVFTRSPMVDTDNVKFVNGDIVNFVNQLKNEEGKNIWIVGGGELLFSFIKEKLIDELIVTVAPIVIGKGIPLFKEGDYQIDLALKCTRNFNQFVELHYEVKDKEQLS